MQLDLCVRCSPHTIAAASLLYAADKCNKQVAEPDFYREMGLPMNQVREIVDAVVEIYSMEHIVWLEPFAPVEYWYTPQT